MLIRIGYEIILNLAERTPLSLMLHVHPSRSKSLRHPERIHLEPNIPSRDFIDTFGNRCVRIVAPQGRLRVWSDNVIEDPELAEPIASSAGQHPIEDIPDNILPFLLGSRYCEVDLLLNIAWSLFGAAIPGWARVQAICDWVHSHTKFDYHQASSKRTAMDLYKSGIGVCRDFQHLAITFCRCMNIPARYATGYLGDIGIPFDPSPMDFSAWFEVYLDGAWRLADARHNKPRLGHVLMAVGRDAADVPLTMTFGVSTLEKFYVWTDEVADDVLRPKDDKPFLQFLVNPS